MHWKRFVGVLACLWSLGCQDNPTGIELRFAVEPALNTEAQVMGGIDLIEVMIAKSDGFNSTGNDIWQSVDVDGDSLHELVLARSLAANEQTFPLFRLLPGGQPQSTEVELWARGLLSSEVTAVGNRSSAGFRSGQNEEVTLQLNLRSSYRSPRVLLTLPHSGQDNVPSALGEIHIEFSKRIAKESVPENLVVIYSGTNGEARLTNPWNLQFSNVKEHGFNEERTTATLDLGSCSLSPGKYRIEAGTGIVDQSGQPLDQDARKSGANGFVATFSVDGQPKADPCSTKETCRSDADCDPAGSGIYVCIKEGQATTGSCSALPASCNELNCPTGWVCNDQALSTRSDGNLEVGYGGQCVLDCRLAAMDCSADTQCDPDSGLCLGANSTTCPDGSCPNQCVDDSCNATGFSCMTDTNNPCPQGSGCDTSTGTCVWCTTQLGCCATAENSGFQTGCDLTVSYCDPYTGECVGSNRPNT